MQTQSCVSFSEKLLNHTRLTSDEQCALHKLTGERVVLPAHTDMVRRGQVVESACLVVEGLLARTCNTASGFRQVTAFYVAGEMPDVHALMMPHATATLTALSRAQVIRLPRNAVRDTVRHFPAIMEAFWRETVIDAAISTQWVTNIGQREAKARIAHLLAEMAVRRRAVIANTFDFSFPATQIDLADATGLSPVHVNRSLQALRAEQVMDVGKGRVYVRDWQKLVAVAEFDDRYLFFGNEPQRLLT